VIDLFRKEMKDEAEGEKALGASNDPPKSSLKTGSLKNFSF